MAKLRTQLCLLLLLFASENVVCYVLFTEAFKISEPTENCTAKPHLPCEVTVEVGECLFDTTVPKAWPGAPDHTSVSYDMVPKPNSTECLARLNISWTIPNDASTYALKGLWMSIMSMSGRTMNIAICVFFNLSEAHWNSEDIQDMILYRYSGVLVQDGEYSIAFNSKPIPPYGQKDNTVLSLITIPFMYQDESHHCHIRKTPEETSPATTPAVVIGPSPAAIRQLSDKEWTPSKKLWTGISLGILGGIILIGVLIGVLRYNRKHSPRGPPGQSDVPQTDEGGSLLPNECLDNLSDVDRYRTPSIAPNGLQATPVLPNTYHQQVMNPQPYSPGLIPDPANAGQPRFVPYTHPDDITDISECVARIHTTHHPHPRANVNRQAVHNHDNRNFVG